MYFDERTYDAAWGLRKWPTTTVDWDLWFANTEIENNDVQELRDLYTAVLQKKTCGTFAARLWGRNTQVRAITSEIVLVLTDKSRAAFLKEIDRMIMILKESSGGSS